VTETEASFEKLLEAHAAYLKASELGMAAERKRSPDTFYDFKPHKIGRYCFPLRWPEIEKSANAARSQWLQSLLQDIKKPSASMTDLACQKAIAKYTVRIGGEVDPALLWRAVIENWEPFLKELRRCNDDSGRLFRSGGIPWQLFVCIFWARPLPLSTKEWPLCFWSDKALVSFFHHAQGSMGMDWSDFTLDKWRKFKRAHHFERPDFIIVRDQERTVNHKGELIGYELKFKRCLSDKRGVAYRAEGGEQSTG
jgi:hypothetical protein